jgi:hypothetical protein
MPGALSDEVLAGVAVGGAADAGGLDIALLGDFLPVLTAAVAAGTPIGARELRTYRALGGSAARQGVALRALLDLYLSAAWRLWAHLPPVRDASADPQRVVVAGEVMLHAVDDVVASLAEGYQLARGALVRAQESARREFIDDLLNGGGDISALLRRAAGFGLDLSGPHAVATVRTERPVDDTDPLVPAAERSIRGRKGDTHPLLASKDGRLVVVFAAPDRDAITQVGERLTRTLGAGRRRLGAWQIGIGRSGVGAPGVLSSYRESSEALLLAQRLSLDAQVIDARDLLVYQVLLRDRAALVDLVGETLTPLRSARGGAGPLIATLQAYFASGGNAARCAREMHLSVRAVTYRLDRVRDLSGLDPNDADDRFTLHVAALGARLLDW